MHTNILFVLSLATFGTLALPDGAASGADAPHASPAGENSAIAETSVIDEDRDFWSFRRLGGVNPPSLDDEAATRNPVDRFIGAQHRTRRLRPAPPADARTFLRRATLDLTGLPPTPEEVDRFLGDARTDAYAQLIDRLLASPHYGERQARHWLDVARFAESSGFEHDSDRPHAWQYRDFLIEAFNNDVGWDEMVRWQVAGDELAPDNPLALKATGFLAAGVFPTQLTEAEFEQARYDELDDMVTAVGVAFLGLSTGCARCHDHKFDPILASDYYRLAAVFGSAIRSERAVQVAPEVFQRHWREWNETRKAKQAALEHATSDDEKSRLEQALAAHLKREPRDGVLPALICTEGATPLRHAADDRGYPHHYRHVYHLSRGDVRQKLKIAAPGRLQVLTAPGLPRDLPLKTRASKALGQKKDDGNGLSFRRAAFARWLTDHEQGAGHLLARVVVNRVWQQHFGRGIVGSPNDFGMQGDRPTHPQLLDWLAVDLVTHGWRLKRLHRLITSSETYQQSVAGDASLASIDVNNRFLWHFPSRRLEAEAIRDSMLRASGQLDASMFGAGVLDETMRRRSIYFTIKRSKPIAFLQVFDWPEHLVSIGRRTETAIAPQALTLLNGPVVRGYAASFADRVSAHANGSQADAVQLAYEIALARKPSTEETRRAAEFLALQTRQYADAGRPGKDALIDFCHALLCSNEFLHLP